MDSEFINRFNERDEITFRVVFEALYPRFLKQAKKEIADHQDAEDTVLWVFAGLWIGDAIFKEYEGIEAYIYYGVRNGIYNYKKRLKIPTSQVFEDYLLIDDEQSEPQNRRRLLYLINKLPDMYKRILLLEIDGLSGVEIAKIEKTTHQIIARRRWVAIQKIKSLINKV